MTRRLVAAALIVATIGVAQGSLLYAAAMPTESAPATTHELEPTGDSVLAAASLVLSGAAASDSSIGCLRGGDYCFGWGSWNCCTEFMVLTFISAAFGNLAAAIISAGAWWYYC